MKTDSQRMDEARFKELLREKGLKVTRQRILILEILEQQAGEHITAEELYEAVRGEYPEIGLATVYRTIQLFLELGLINSVTLGDGCVRYEMESREEQHHHHHIVCLRCGKVLSFGEDLLESLEQRIMEDTGFQILDHEVKFYGYCGACAGEQG